MRRLYVLGLAMALLALAMPATAESIHERNVSYLWSLVGDADPSTPVTMNDGRVLALADAIEDAADRAGSIDLAALASGAAVPDGTYAGDIWILEYGPGPCTSTVIAPGSPTFVAVDGQLWIYTGGIGTMSGGDAYYTYLIAWTMKMTAMPDHWEAIGNMDFYCFGFSGLHFAFPFINGVVQTY